MLDISVSYNRYKFLGHEFLTWLWFVAENDHGKIPKSEEGLASLAVGNRIVLENNQRNVVESITIKGDDAGLEEGILALRKGAFVTEINLFYKLDDQEWYFTIKGESLSISGLRTPDTGSIGSRKDLDGAVIEKTYLYNEIIQLIDILFKEFIKLRISEDWDSTVVPRIRQWIYS
ncbi:MAG: hypothetical protein SVY10_14960 [Thermodesulfobacteriota bacterium]|nr:hypothetical protein [Thermodesulfobacteriota bacterium]